MNEPVYLLTQAAETDLRDIIRYTRREWGDAQVRRYIRRLESCMQRLASGETPFTDMSKFHPGLRMLLCQHHYLFCLPHTPGPALIVALLHERMDLITRPASGCKPAR